MSDEAILKLAAALDRLAASIEKCGGLGALGGGIHVYHHNQPPMATPPLWQQPGTAMPPYGSVGTR